MRLPWQEPGAGTAQGLGMERALAVALAEVSETEQPDARPRSA
ncbi:MAG: hypothetical protein AAFY48_15230 [Bacteroidota bacterium]